MGMYVRCLILVAMVVSIVGPDADASELDELVTPEEKEFLFTELARIQPPERIRELARYSGRQSELGGGFYGMMPDQLVDPDRIPVPVAGQPSVAAALGLARQRQANRIALDEINPDFPKRFQGRTLVEFLETVRAEAVVDAETDVHLDLDATAIEGFLVALADGEVTPEEAMMLASLPSNQAMLEHRRNLGYVPEPLPGTESLASFIAMAGSTDPLDRLWCWISSQNAFGYADLFQNQGEYRLLVAQLDRDGDRLSRAALARISRFTPSGTRFTSRFAFTVGWAVRGWATADMAGLNIEQVKDDWHFLFGTLLEETYHRLQLEMFPFPTAKPLREFEDLVRIDTGDERLDRLYEIVAYTVAEGSANFVRGPFAAEGLAAKAPQGAELMLRFTREVVGEGRLDRADALINEGLNSNGPLYGLGWTLASAIADREGERAVGEWQQRGPISFFLHAAELCGESGTTLLDPSVVAAVRRLE